MCAAKSQMFFCEREWNIQSAKNSAQDTLINRKTACWQTGVFVVKWQKHIMQGQWRKIRSFWKLQRAGGWCEPVRKNEAVWFPSRFCEQPSGSVMKPGFPRYWDRTCWSLKRLPFGSNQGGTTDFYSSLRLLWPQGLFCFAYVKNHPFVPWANLLLQLCTMKIPQYTKYSGISMAWFEAKSSTHTIKKWFLTCAIPT